MIPTSALSQNLRTSLSPLGKKIKAVLVWPKFPQSYWSFAGMMELLPEKVVMPPLGLITVAALCPKDWTMRLVDESLEAVTDEDLRWADLVMVGGMEVQRPGMLDVLARARKLGRRTIVGGPCASSNPQRMLALADHVVVGEPDAEFGEITAALENGTARQIYEVTEKPDVTLSPIPRFDLLKLDSYA